MQARFSRTSMPPPLTTRRIADLEAALKMKRDVHDNKYIALNDKRSKVRMGVAGSPDYGKDSPLYDRHGTCPHFQALQEKQSRDEEPRSRR